MDIGLCGWVVSMLNKSEDETLAKRRHYEI